MRRRQFITLLSGVAASWPLAAHAQQAKMPVVGFLNAGSPDGYAPYVTGFLLGLAETGYVEGKRVAVDYRWARGQYDQLRAMAADLVRLNVAVIAAHGLVMARSARAQTAVAALGQRGDPHVKKLARHWLAQLPA